MSTAYPRSEKFPALAPPINVTFFNDGDGLHWFANVFFTKPFFSKKDKSAQLLIYLETILKRDIVNMTLSEVSEGMIKWEYWIKLDRIQKPF